MEFFQFWKEFVDSFANAALAAVSDPHFYSSMSIGAMVGGGMGAIWAPWGMKHGKDFEKECCKEDKKD